MYFPRKCLYGSLCPFLGVDDPQVKTSDFVRIIKNLTGIPWDREREIERERSGKSWGTRKNWRKTADIFSSPCIRLQLSTWKPLFFTNISRFYCLLFLGTLRQQRDQCTQRSRSQGSMSLIWTTTTSLIDPVYTLMQSYTTGVRWTVIKTSSNSQECITLHSHSRQYIAFQCNSRECITFLHHQKVQSFSPSARHRQVPIRFTFL